MRSNSPRRTLFGQSGSARRPRAMPTISTAPVATSRSASSGLEIFPAVATGVLKPCLKPRSPACRPRIHDLRHSFAVATLLGWHRSGADVQARMPQLSAYLGHSDPRHTYSYMSAAPELLAVAAGRLQAFQEEESP